MNPSAPGQKKPVAWITGAAGLIGHYLWRTAAAFGPAWEAVPLSRLELDLTDFKGVQEAYHRQSPALILHCAALSRSPICQSDPGLARRINVEATARLAGLPGETRLVFLSTDLVFDGRKGNYREEDPVNPLSVYAETKVQAESQVLSNPRHLVIRTSLNGGTSPTGDRGFNEELRRAWLENRPVRLFTDEYRCPIPALATAQAIWELASQGRSGLYHLAGADRLSRWQIGRLVASRWPHLQPQLIESSIKDYQGPPRPPDTSLNCSKAAAVLPFPLPSLSRWLEENPQEVF